MQNIFFHHVFIPLIPPPSPNCSGRWHLRFQMIEVLVFFPKAYCFLCSCNYILWILLAAGSEGVSRIFILFFLHFFDAAHTKHDNNQHSSGRTPPPSSKIFITFDPKVGSDRCLILLVGNNRAHAAIPILAVFFCPLIIFGAVSPRHHWIGKIFIFLEPTVRLDCCLIQRIAYSHAHASIYNSGVSCHPLFILFW